MSRPAWTAAAVLYLASVGCDPSPSGAVEALVADLTEAGYRPVVRPIETLDDSASLRGRVAVLRAGGDVLLAVPESTPSTLQGFRDAMVFDPGEVVRPRWATVDGALYPRDFDTFALTTLYHHLEQAVLYYESFGVTLPEPLDVHYLGHLELPGFEASVDMTDNALYFFGVRFLVVTRFELLQDVPLGMNRGVVVHEMGHAMFDQLVYDDEARLRLLEGNIDDRTANLLRSVTEGLSDYFAAAQTGDPSFLDASVPRELLSFPRDVDDPLVYTSGILGTSDAAPAIYDPYLPGTCLASALWRLPVGSAVLGTALFEAQRAFGERLRTDSPWDAPPDDFGFAWFLDALVPLLDPSLRAEVCDIFVSQLPAAAVFMSECP